MNQRYLITLLAAALLIISSPGAAQSSPLSNYFPEIKILESNDPAPGYYFLAAKGVSAAGAELYIAIVDNWGTPLFFRLMPKASVSMRLLEDGTIGYVHGVPRKLYLMDSMLNVTDTINTIGAKLDGHDWDIDDKGDYHRLVFAQYTRIADMSQLVDGGNPAAEIGEAMIQEFDAENQLVSSWRTEDLFEVLDGNELSPFVDFTEASIDYAHLNGVEFYTDSSFLLSTRHMEEITHINRRTGEIIWRLGGKNNDFTFIDDPLGFSHQHSPRILENGNLLLFDNGNLHDPQFSSAVEYELDETGMTARLVNRYRRVPDAFAPRDGYVQRLKNGNTVITWGPVWPSMTEFHPDGTVALEIDMTEHSLSPRIAKYEWETSVFVTSADTLDFGMYNGSDPVELTLQLFNQTDSLMHITGVTGRTGHFSVSTPLPLAMVPGEGTDLTIRFEPLGSSTGFMRDVLTISSDNASQRIARQLYTEGYQQDDMAPEVVIMPDSANVPLNAQVNLEFSEPVVREDGSEISYANLHETVDLRKDDPEGESVPFRATVSTDRMLITIYPDSLLQNGTTYYVVLTAPLEDYSGNALAFIPGTFSTLPGTAVKKIREGELLLVYPNPSTGLFRIRTAGNAQNLHLQVHSSTGSLVWERRRFHPDADVIDLQGNAAGIYYLTARSSNLTIPRRARLLLLNSR